MLRGMLYKSALKNSILAKQVINKYASWCNGVHFGLS